MFGMNNEDKDSDKIKRKMIIAICFSHCAVDEFFFLSFFDLRRIRTEKVRFSSDGYLTQNDIYFYVK